MLTTALLTLAASCKTIQGYLQWSSFHLCGLSFQLFPSCYFGQESTNNHCFPTAILKSWVKWVISEWPVNLWGYWCLSYSAYMDRQHLLIPLQWFVVHFEVQTVCKIFALATFHFHLFQVFVWNSWCARLPQQRYFPLQLHHCVFPKVFCRREREGKH